MQKRVCLSILAVVVFCHIAAAGEDPAMTAFEEARGLYDELRYAEAAARFREAYDLKPSWKIYYNIGQAEAAATNHGLALEAFEKYLVHGGDEIDDVRRDEVHKEVDRLYRLVGTVTVTAPEGARVTIDGVYRGKAPFPGGLKISVGKVHVVEVTLDDRPLLSRDLTVSRGETVTLVASDEMADPGKDADEDDAPTNAGAEAKAPRSKAFVVAGSTLVALGASGLGVGTAFSVRAVSLARDLEENCEQGICPKKYEATGEDRDRAAMVATIGLVAGGALAATGIVLFIVHGAKKKRFATESVFIVPVAGDSFAGIDMTWRF